VYPAYQSYNTYQPQPVSNQIPITKAVSKPSIIKSSSLPIPYKGAFLSLPSGSGDIIQQTRAQANSLKKDLIAFSSNPRAAMILSKVFADPSNVCFNNIDDAVDAIETSAKLFENGGTEIKQLVEMMKVFKKQTDVPTAVRQTSKILLLLDVLVPKITPASTCVASSDDVFASMRSLAVLLNELSSRNDVYFSIQKRQSLKSSAKILTKVATFLTQLKSSFSKFDQFCTEDKEYNIEVVTAISDVMTDLADLYTDLGGETVADEVRKQGDFTKKIVKNIKKFGDLELGSLDCNNGTSQSVAKTLNDLAGLIEDVGMDSLCQQLDLDCTF